MNDITRSALRSLDESCRLKKPCVYGAKLCTFGSYEKRGNDVLMELIGPDKQPINVKKSLDILSAFMDRANAGLVADTPLLLDNLVPDSMVHPNIKRKMSKNEPVTIWRINGKPNYITMSHHLSIELERLNPSRKISVNFNRVNPDDENIYILLTDVNSRMLIKGKDDRLRIRCDTVSDKIKYDHYAWSFGYIEHIQALILKPSKK